MTSHFRQLIDALPQAVLVHRNGRPLFVNAKFSGLTGCPPEDLNAVKALVTADPWQRWLTNSGEHAAVSVVDKKGQALSLRARRTEVPWKGGPAWMETLEVRPGEGADGNGAEGNLEYRALADGLPHGVMVHQGGRVHYVNPALVRLLGFPSSREAYRANNALQRFDSGDIYRMMESAEPVGTEPAAAPIEVQVTLPSGPVLALSTTSSLIDWQGGAAVATVVMDVTAQRRAEQASAAEARHHSHAEEVAHIGHWAWDLSSQGITWSDGAYRIYGRTREEFQPTVKNALTAVHPDDREAVADALNVALREGKSFTQEFRALSPDGAVRQCIDQVSVELDAAGNPKRLLGVLMDVTDGRGSQQAHDETRRLLETVIDAIPYDVFVKDAEGRFIIVNTTEAANFHMTPGLMAGRRTQDLTGIDPARIAESLEEDRRVLETGETIIHEQRPARMIAQAYGWRRARKVPLRNAEGRVVGVVALSEDITARVHAEQQLKAHQQLLNTVMETIPHGIFVKDAAGNYLLANTRYATAFGITPEGIQGLHTEQLPGFTPDTIASTNADDEAILSSAKPYVEREFPSPAPGTRGQIHRLIKVPMRDDQGQVTAVVGVVENVTERREQAARLEESEQLLKSVLESIPLALFVKDLSGRYVLVNGQFAGRFGMTPEQVHGLRAEDLPGVGGEFLETTRADDMRALKDDAQIVRDDVRAPSPGQQGQWRRLLKRRLRRRDGEVIGIIGTTEDITQRKEAELRLQEKEQLLQSVVESIPQGVFAKDPSGRIILVNTLYAERVNLRPDQVVGKRLDELPGISPEFAALMAAQDARVLASGEQIVSEEPFQSDPARPAMWLRIIKQRLFDQQGGVIGVIGTSENVTQRREADQQLAESRRLLQTIIDTLPQSIFLKDLEGRYLLVNDVYCRIRGMTREATVGRFTEDVSGGTPQQVADWKAMDQEVVRTHRPVMTPDYPHVYPDGHHGIRTLTKLPFFDAHGVLAGVLGISEDITERREAQEKLRSSERLLQAVFDAIPHSVFVKDAEGRYTTVNRAMAELWQVNAEDIIGHKVVAGNRRPMDESEMVATMDSAVLHDGQTTENTPKQTLPDGTLRIMRVKKTPLRNAQGGIIGLVGTAEDITPYTEALEKVSASERLLQTVIDTLPQAVFLKDLEGAFLIVNEAYARSHSMTKEEALQVKIPQLPGGTEEQKNQWAAQDRHVLETGTAAPTEILPFTLPSGEVRIRTLTKLPVHDANGVLVGILGVSDDITERQEAEQRVRQSQRLLQTVIDTCPQAIFLKNVEGRYLVINDTFARIRGISKSDILGADNSELPHASREEQAQWVEDDRRVIGRGVTIGPKEYPFTLPDGSLTMRMLYKLPVQDESGAVIGVLGVSEDITERRKQEVALRESERLLQTMFDAIPLDVWVKGRDRRYVRVNPAMARRWHTTPEALVGQMAPTTDQTPEGEAGRIATSDLHVLEEGKMLDQYMLRTEPDGRRRIHHQIKSPLRNEAGEVIGIVGVAEDVTEMRRAEQELRASREQLRLVLEATAEGWWECDIPSQRMQYSPGWLRLFGYSEAEIPKNTDEWKALIHPEDVDRVLRTVVGSLKEEDGRFDAEYRVRHKSGEYVWVADRGKVVARDAKGVAVRQVGAFFDIRRRKRAEEDLKASQRLLQTVFDTIPHPVFVKDREGRYMAVNRAMTDLWQTTAERVIGQKVILQTHRPENEARNTQQSDQEVMTTGKPQAFIRTQTLLDGKIHRLDMKKTPLVDESGRVIGLVGVLQDITEQEQAQEALRENQRLLNAVINALPWGLTAKDREGRFMLVNPTVLSFYNTTPDALLGRTSLDIPWFTPEDRKRFYDEDMQVIRSGKVLEVPEESHPIANGATIVRRIIKSPILDDQGQVAGLIAVTEDITRRVEAERKLRESQRLLQTMFDNLTYGLTLKDAQGRYVIVNAAMLSRYGGTVEEFIGKKSSEVRYFPRDLAVELEKEDERVIADGRTMIMPIREVHYPDGTTRIRRFIKIPMKDDQGRPSGVMTASEDITQQVFAERELLRSKALLQTIFDTIPMDIQVKDAESRIVTMNKRMLENFKLTEADVVGRHTPGPVSATDLERILAADRQVMGSGRTFEEVQHRVMADGSRRHYRILKSPLREGSGKVTGVVGVAEDITIRVNAELESQRSKALLQTVFDTIPLDILVKDQECRIVAMNKRMLKSFDLKDGEFNGRYTPLPVSEQEMAAILNTDRTVMATGRSTDEIHHRTMPDGSRRHYRVIKSALRDEAGKSFGVVGIAEDITERLASDAALQRSRALLQAVFDTIPHDVWVKDRDARYVQANRQLLETFGTTMEAIAGRPNAMPASPTEMEAITRSDMTVIRSGQTSDLISSRTFPDGSVHQFRVIKTPLRDETGQVAGLVGIAEDVTDRMRSERELRESRLLLQAVFDALPLWVFVKTPESKIVMVNKQMATDYGMDPVGVVTLTNNDPADQETQEQARALDVQALNSDGPVEITDYRHTIRGQPTRLLRSVRKAIRDANGVPTLIVGISEDITEKRRAEQALLQTQKLESLGILAGGIAHDFNNLLTGILGNVELALLELEGEHHARPPLNNVKNASLMAAGLTRQMLAYSGGGRFELRPILLNALVEDMAQLLRVTVPRHVNVVYRFEPSLPLVEADASQLQQVIMNLITNASEAMGDRPGDVVLTTGVAHVSREELATYHLAGDVAPGDYVLLQVTDSGSGMAPGTLQRIFDPFFTTKFTGRGLGLAAVLGIVRSHKGAIRVTSEQGKGTTFRILLPTGGVAAPHPIPAAAAWTGGGTVLVVDDEAHVRQVSASMLRRLGMDVLEASGGDEAVRLVREHGSRIGWVLLDASMPGLSGPDALRAMRQAMPNLVVVMMSGYGEREVQDRFRGMNVRGFLQKPFTFEDLSAKLSAWLGAGSVGKPKPS